MGGIVAQLLLDEMDDDVLRAVYTMSTPSLLSPVRFDRRSDAVYSMAKRSQTGDINSTTPLISICGGSTDSQITSEVCALPERESPLRRTIMTTSLEGAWTGVGHREMVWCHQVRSLVARSALALAHDNSSNDSIDVILRTRASANSPLKTPLNIENEDLHYIRHSNRWDLGTLDEGTYMLPLSGRKKLRLTLFAGGARLDDFSLENNPQQESGTIRVLYCSRPAPTSPTRSCIKLAGKTSSLPRQEWPGEFPASKGVHDNDALTMFEADIDMEKSSGDDHVAISIKAQKSERWIVAAVEEINDPISSATTWGMI
jgi:GPI inositol-deacylase